jgi:putative DNA primase/helicase
MSSDMITEPRSTGNGDIQFDKDVERIAAENKAKQGANGHNPDRDDKAFIAALANLPELDYELQRTGAAKAIGIRADALDKLVCTARGSQPESPLYPHWQVEPASEPVDAERLLTQVLGCIRSHVVMPEESARVVALWIAMTWVHDVAAIHSPILLVTSPEPNSGKSTLLGVLSFLVRRSLTSVGIGAAPLYRAIEKWQPTIIVDEGDTAFVDNEDLRGAVNSGWTRGQGVIRCDAETHEPRLFSTFCPKAVGMIGRRLPAATLSRAIVIEMARKKSSERTIDFEYVDDDSLAELRSDLARYGADNANQLHRAHPALPQGFENRRAANWRLLLAIADTGGEEWGRKARTAAEKITGTSVSESVGTDLLSDIRKVFDAKPDSDCILSRQLIELLTADPESRWCEWGRDRKPITQKQLASLLHGFHIISTTVHPDDQRHGKGYRRADFEEAWGRYLPPETPPDVPSPPSEACKRASAHEMGTSSTFRSVQERKPARIENTNLANKNAGLHACTLEKPESGNGGMAAPFAAPIGHICNSHSAAISTPAAPVGLCAQCRGDEGAPPVLCKGEGFPAEGIWLHRECVRFWRDLSIPTFLDRTRGHLQ